MSSNKLKVLCGAVLLGSASTVTMPALASETMMKLIDIMRQNGTITQAQYEQLKAAAMEDDKQMTETKVAKSEVDARMASMDWTSKVKLKGDFRLRYQYEDNDANLDASGHQVERERDRIRYRLGVIATPMTGLEVGAGLASGGADPRSTNQTLDDSFSSKGINLDYAYAQYQVSDTFKAIGGKFVRKNYLWAPTDLVWDGDINPEGVSANYTVGNGAGKFFANGGAWALKEYSKDENDPYMLYGQLGQMFGNDDLYGTVAAIYYDYQDVDAATFNPSYRGGTNTDFDFDAWGFSMEIGTKSFMGGAMSAALVGDYVQNTDTDTNDDTGFSIGGTFGVDRWGFTYLYADLDANAVPDVLPDSDRFGGKTDIKGHELILTYALAKNVELGLDYYQTERKSLNIDEKLLQADIVVKF